MPIIDETAAPLSLSVGDASLPELWILEGGLEALLANIPDTPDDISDIPPAPISIAGIRRLQ